MNKEFNEGYASYNKNNSSYLNPYKSGSSQYNDFERGWTQANKRLPAYEFISGEYSPDGKHVETALEKNMREKEEEKQKLTAAYLKAKG